MNNAGNALLIPKLHFVQFWGCNPQSVGVFNGEGPPVPIPNTEVKLACADDTRLETDWENRSVPTLIALERSGRAARRIQSQKFLKKNLKNSKKGVDKRIRLCYSNIAVAACGGSEMYLEN